MSEEQTTGADTVVYVRLLDEGTDVWRPVQASALPDGSFEFAQPEDYDPQAESWEFPPHAKVRCIATQLDDGENGLVAVARA